MDYLAIIGHIHGCSLNSAVHGSVACAGVFPSVDEKDTFYFQC